MSPSLYSTTIFDNTVIINIMPPCSEKTIRLMSRNGPITCLQSINANCIRGTVVINSQRGEDWTLSDFNEESLFDEQKLLCYATVTEDWKEDKRPWNIVLKIATGKKIPSLEHEAQFYVNNLHHFQGTIVPRFYGLFKGEHEGSEMACMAIEWCGGIFPKYNDDQELNRQRMFAAARLHAAGINHGGLEITDFVPGHDNAPRIVGFSRASIHKCKGSVPWVISGEGESGCTELDELERTFGCSHAHIEEIKRDPTIRRLMASGPEVDLSLDDQLTEIDLRTPTPFSRSDQQLSDVTWTLTGIWRAIGLQI